MNKKTKFVYKTVLSLILSAALFCMPIVAVSLNKNNSISVRAEDNGQESKEAEIENSAKKSDAEEHSAGQETKNSGNEQETETEQTESSTEDETVSGSDRKPECICKEKCSAYEYDHRCEICANDYQLCAYQKPNVSINIYMPKGWFHHTATITFDVEDIARTGNFEIAKIQTKIGQNGSWTDRTEERELEISENCTVYVQVTDQKGNTYEKNRTITCFDTTKPTLNAAVSSGLLTIQAQDADSGVKAVYVNGYEFTEPTGGTLNIRLQQFDAGYEYFTILAVDNAGNLSEAYQTKNPYYKDPADTSDENPAEQLPVSAEASEPGNAAGTVKEHIKTDNSGTVLSQTSEEQKKEASDEATAAKNTKAENTKAENTEAENAKTESGNSATGQGREFYTIQTATEKVFYLIIERDGEEEQVYFLTEITENDLLNTTSGNSQTLPKNSAALESAVPIKESALPNNNGKAPEDTLQEGETAKETDYTEDMEHTEETKPEKKAEEPNPVVSYLILGVLAVAFIGGAYYFKVIRKKKEDFLEDEDGDEEDEEEYENEEEQEDLEDEFFEKEDE